MRRLRLVSLQIRPMIMIDDGEHLTLLDSPWSEIPSSELDGMIDRLRADIQIAETHMNRENSDVDVEDSSQT